MGRLFWKFFFSILLAQIAATVGIGGTLWLQERDSRQVKRLDIDTSPPAELAIDAAEATLAAGGPAALAKLLDTMSHHRVFAVDEQGKELLGRIVAPAMVTEAQALLAKGDTRVVRKVTIPTGRTLLLFLPARAHQHGPEGAALGALERGSLAGQQLPGERGPGDHGRGDRGPGERGQGDPGPTERGPTDRGPTDRGPTDRSPDGRPQPPGGALPEPGMDGPRGPRFRPLTPFVPLAAAVLASLLFAALLAWYFARPIRSLRQAFEAASHGDLTPRFTQSAGQGSDELSDLGRDFDRMTARLRSLMDGQTRLLHDVSHELRSPLARLQAAIGLVHQKPERMSASLARIERESVRMDKLVGELLTLSRLEAGALAAHREEIDMADLVGQIVTDAEFEAASHGRHVVQRGGADVVLLGEADLLARAIENVVRNAIKHSPEGETVVVETATPSTPAGCRLVIRVLDRGPGVAQADLQAIFAPFFRSSGTEKDVDGHGLGLAIARQVVQQHGGTIVAGNRDGGGLAVEIALPLD